MNGVSDEKITRKAKVAKIYKQSERTLPDWDLVRKYLPLLKSIVGKMIINFPSNVDRENIYTVGLLGLISASQTYTKEQTETSGFGAYARIRIKGALLDELRSLDWLPRSVRARLKNFQQKLALYELKLKRPLSDEEICNYLHVDKQELFQFKQLLKPVVFIPLELNPDPRDENDSLMCYSLEDKLADLSQNCVRETCERNEIKQLLKSFLKELPKLIQQIFALHYGKGLYLSEIASLLNLSESRICQIHAETIANLRRKLIRALKE